MKRENMKRRKVIECGLGFFAVLGAFLYWQNKDIVIRKLDYSHEQIPTTFKGYKILQVSDLHNTSFGKHQKRLIKKTQDIKPDCIVITGDIIDCHRIDIDVAIQYVEAAVKIAPVYYVSGNHEGWSDVYETLRLKLEESGVHILEDDVMNIYKNKDYIRLMGLGDRIIPQIEERLKSLTQVKDEDVFTILLSHRPEYIESYAKFPVDLVFSGHAHGGQIRLPFIGGLYAPGQGVFPTYTSGLYQHKDTSMIVSRGMGNSVFPFRIFNRPELVVVTLN